MRQLWARCAALLPQQVSADRRLLAMPDTSPGSPRLGTPRGDGLGAVPWMPTRPLAPDRAPPLPTRPHGRGAGRGGVAAGCTPRSGAGRPHGQTTAGGAPVPGVPKRHRNALGVEHPPLPRGKKFTK